MLAGGGCGGGNKKRPACQLHPKNRLEFPSLCVLPVTCWELLQRYVVLFRSVLCGLVAVVLQSYDLEKGGMARETKNNPQRPQKYSLKEKVFLKK